jgi:riboflavin transporter FmnP
MNTNRNSAKIKKIAAISMFCALSYVVMMTIRIPVMFLTLDIKDSVIVLCSLLYGPVAGLSAAVVVPVLELITVGDTGVYGFIMDVLSSVTFALVAGLIYRYKRTLTGAMIGLASAVATVTAVMLLANLLITPYYMGATVADVAALIPKVLLPFNLVKSVLNAAIVLLFYKPLSKVLKKSRLITVEGSAPAISTSEQAPKASAWTRFAVPALALILIATSMAIVFFVLRK